MAIKPIRNQVLFMPYMGKGVTDGGIFIPDSCKTLSNRGEVKATGHLVTKVKAGEVAYRVKDWGVELIENGTKFYLMHEDAILATD